MLLEFSISNFRSVKERQTFSMLASAKVKERYNAPFVLESYKKIQVLKTAVFYGKNNSGKSNILRAFDAFREFVTGSDSYKIDTKIKTNDVFLFDQRTLNQPTIFEIDFIGNNQIYYRYEVEFSEKEIIKEKLSFYRPNAEKMKLNEVFSREKMTLSYRKDLSESEKRTLEDIKNAMLNNQLFLSLSSTKNVNEHLTNAYLFFSQKLNVYTFDSNFEEKIFVQNTMQLLRERSDFLPKINDLLKVMDTGILKLELQEREMEVFKFREDISDDLKSKIVEMLKYSIEAQHRLFDGEKEIGTKNIPIDSESTGTQKLFSLLAIILEAFEKGSVLMIDELDKSLNPYWTKFLIKLFYNEQFNPNHTQLVFVSHDAAQIQEFLFAKDQINIIDKDYFGKTEINNFAQYTGVRKDIPFDKWYLSGRLGGVPVIDTDYIQFEMWQKSRHFNKKID